MMKPRCIKGVLSESYYNHAWIGHVMSQALERPLLTCFLTDVSGVNIFTAKKMISRHISPMIKGVEYRFPMVSTIFRNQKSSVKPKIKMQSRC